MAVAAGCQPDDARDLETCEKSWWRSKDHATTEVDSGSRAIANAPSLAFFVRLLNRTDDTEAVIAGDPGLSGVSNRVGECVHRNLGLMQPPEVACLLTPLTNECFSDML